jgi:hypothetical protein
MFVGMPAVFTGMPADSPSLIWSYELLNHGVCENR